MNVTIRQPAKWQAWTVLTLLVVLGLIVRYRGFADQSLWSDEVATWQQVNGSLTEVFVRTAADTYPPLYNVLTWISVQFLGESATALRLPALLLGLANIVAIYGLGASVGGRTAGLMAALLLCLSGFHAWYSQEARMYTLLACTATAHGWAMLRYLDGAERRRDAVIVGLSGVALVYSHPYGGLTWIAIGLGALFVLLQRPDRRAIIGLVVTEFAIALGFLPWALLLLRRAGKIAENGFWIDYPTPDFVLSALSAVTGSLFVPLLLTTPLLLIFRKRLPQRLAKGAIPVLLAWTLLPLAIGIGLSVAFQPIFIPRYAIGSLPPFLVLLAMAMLAPVRSPRGLVLAVAVCITVGLWTALFQTPSPRADWRDALADLRTRLRPGDGIALMQPFQKRMLDYYLGNLGYVVLSAPTGAAVGEVPAGNSIYLVAVGETGEVRSGAANDIAAVRPLTDLQRFHRVELYTFGPRPLFDPR